MATVSWKVSRIFSLNLSTHRTVVVVAIETALKSAVMSGADTVTVGTEVRNLDGINDFKYAFASSQVAAIAVGEDNGGLSRRLRVVIPRTVMHVAIHDEYLNRFYERLAEQKAPRKQSLRQPGSCCPQYFTCSTKKRYMTQREQLRERCLSGIALMEALRS